MHRLREVVFLSQVWAEAMLPSGQESLISVTDRHAALADLNDGWHRVLRLQFDDLDLDDHPPDAFEEGLVPLSGEQAEEIADFVKSIASQSSTLVVHCKYGQSRSPAIAKAVCQYFDLDFPKDFNSHNRFVHRLVFNALCSRWTTMPSPGRSC